MKKLIGLLVLFYATSALAYLPSGVLLTAANKVAFQYSNDGLYLKSSDTSVQANPVGGFVGGGIGNKGFVQLTNYNGMPLSTLSNISFTGKVIYEKVGSATPNGYLYFNLLVDCAGNGNASDYHIMVIDNRENSIQKYYTMTSAYQVYSVDLTKNSLSIVGGYCNTPASSNPLTAPNLPANGISLAAFSALNPNAKLVNAQFSDNGFVKNDLMAGIQVVMGDSGTKDPRIDAIKAIVINSDIYYFGN